MTQSVNLDKYQPQTGTKSFQKTPVIKKVLLIQPPAYTNNKRSYMNPNPPLGIAYIAAVLRKEGYEVSILDAFIEGWDRSERITSEKLLVGISFDEIRLRIEKLNPDLVGITSMFTCQRKNVHQIAKIVKEISINIPVIVGGAHPSAATSSVIQDKNIDFAVLGEGEPRVPRN